MQIYIYIFVRTYVCKTSTTATNALSAKAYARATCNTPFSYTKQHHSPLALCLHKRNTHPNTTQALLPFPANARLLLDERRLLSPSKTRVRTCELVHFDKQNSGYDISLSSHPYFARAKHKLEFARAKHKLQFAHANLPTWKQRENRSCRNRTCTWKLALLQCCLSCTHPHILKLSCHIPAEGHKLTHKRTQCHL